MFRNLLVIGSALGFAISLAAADVAASKPALSATQIVDKNVAARGGLEAWRAVKTMSLEGKLGAGGNQRATLQVPGSAPAQVVGRRNRQFELQSARPVEEVYLPFLMELERPRKMRFELQFAGQTAIQVYDGAQGWKLRPFLNRRVVEPFSEDELKVSTNQADLDGPLVDYRAKGTRVELAGMEKVENRETYKIKMIMKSGQALHVWVDGETFLEAKIEAPARRLDGADHPVEVYFRDYRNVDGLQIPFGLETRVVPIARNGLGLRDTPVQPEKTLIEKVVLNPKFDEGLFSKPSPDAGLSAKTQ